MSKQDEQFRPELVDEQVETLSYIEPEDTSSSARLVSDLHQIYKEDSEIVEQVWTRLTVHAAEKNRSIADQENTSDSSLRARRGDSRKKLAYMKLPHTGRRSRFLELSVAVLILGILVGSTVLFLQAQQSSPTTGKLSTPTEISTKTIPIASDQTGLYVSAPDELARIDLQTNKTVWSKATRYPMPVITRGIVIFNSQESSQPLADSLLEAVDAANGQELWHKHYRTVSNHQAANGVVYVSLCDLQCSISALKANDGEQLWSYDTSRLGTPSIQVRDGVVYGIMNTQFFALNATTGALIWQKNLPYSGQQASTAPQVINKVLYFASCETSATSTPVASNLYAIDATNGEELWHTHVDGPVFAPLIAADDTVYAGSNVGLLYALDARTGSVLWTYNTGDLMIKSLLATTGTVYIETVTQNGSSAHLLVLNATDRSLIWSKDLGAISGPGPDWQTLALENGLIYAIEGKQNVSVFHSEDGSAVQSYSVADSAPLTGFRLVLQNDQ